MVAPATGSLGQAVQVRSHLRSVHSEYLAAAAEARMASPFRLRWLYRRLHREGGELALARLRAVEHELAERGLEPPEVAG